MIIYQISIKLNIIRLFYKMWFILIVIKISCNLMNIKTYINFHNFFVHDMHNIYTTLFIELYKYKLFLIIIIVVNVINSIKRLPYKNIWSLMYVGFKSSKTLGWFAKLKNSSPPKIRATLLCASPPFRLRSDKLTSPTYRQTPKSFRKSSDGNHVG